MKGLINSEKAPKAIGPYSQAISAGSLIFLSGQLPIDPATGQFPGDGIEAQTRQSLKNLGAVLEAAGCTLDDVVKCNVYLQDMNDFAAMNAVYGEFFKAPFPARAAVQVARLPKDARVEIEAVALLRK